AESYLLVLSTIVFEGVRCSEGDPIGAVPEQPFLPVLQLQPNVRPRGGERQGNALTFALIHHAGRGLRLRRAPGRGDSGLQVFVLTVRALKDGLAQDHPGDGGTHKNKRNSKDLLDDGHGIFSGTFRRREDQHGPKYLEPVSRTFSFSVKALRSK